MFPSCVKALSLSLFSDLQRALLRYWFDHMRKVQPGIYVTYNGDFFDWPFIEARALVHGMVMYDVSGFA